MNDTEFSMVTIVVSKKSLPKKPPKNQKKRIGVTGMTIA
jgi:hypothetical protein